MARRLQANACLLLRGAGHGSATIGLPHPKGVDHVRRQEQSHGQDRQRINIHQDYELRDWAKSLNTTPERLKEAVQAVGDRAEKVREYLAKGQARADAKSLAVLAPGRRASSCFRGRQPRDIHLRLWTRCAKEAASPSESARKPAAGRKLQCHKA
jgi:hypothetical protein